MRSSRKKNRTYLISAIAAAAVLLVVLLAALLWLESGSGMNPENTGSPTQTPTGSVETTEATTDIPAQELTTAPTAEPVAAPDGESTTVPTEMPTTEPTAEVPTQTPTTEPTVAPITEPTVAPTTAPTEAPVTEPTAAPTTEPTMAPTTEPVTEPENNVLYGTGTVDTPYLTLYYDEAFADHLKITVTAEAPYTLEYCACLEGRDEQHLFTIIMGEGAAGNLGMIQTDLGIIPVSIVFCEIDQDTLTDDEFNTILAMQDGVNDLIDQLMEHRVQEDPVDPTLPPETPDNAGHMEITTPYCKLSYPAAWQEYLCVERNETAEEYRILFYGQVEGKEPVLLFTIIFGGDSGEQVGALIMDGGQIVPVNIELNALELSGYTDDEATILYSMQEAANQLISELPLA